jgi:hypothetical protein
MHLLRWAMTLDAVLLQQRLNIATEINFAGDRVG